MIDAALPAPLPDDALGRLDRLFCAHFADPDHLVRRGGRITEVAASFFRVSGLESEARLGDIVEHRGRTAAHWGEITRVKPDGVVVSPFGDGAEAGLGDAVFRLGPLRLAPTREWRGRAVDALGRPIDDGSALPSPPRSAGQASAAPRALARARLGHGLKTGVRVVDIFTPLCFGQRVGVFAGSGVGKSTLLAMLARAESFDTVVVALVGERGREVREFLEDTLGEAGRAKTVAVVATGDEAAALRKRAPLTAMSIAEHFRDCGENVLLVLDSVTRFAHAAREVASAAGEPPVARGYPASVFTELPKLLERAGPGAETGGGRAGSITAIVSVLVDGDDMNDPVADSVRGILDGHLVLRRAIAEENRFPAVDPLASLSRLAPKLWSADERALVGKLRGMIARFEETRDIRLLGAYQAGSDPVLDNAIRQVPVIYEALVQRPDEPHSADALADLARFLRGKEGRDG